MRLETSQDGKISLELSSADLAAKYFSIKELVVSKGYLDEIEWQSSLCFNDLDESSFLEELSWVILSSGMKESVIRKLFDNISRCFFYWSSSNIIIKNKEKCFNNAICYFNNKSKISSIIFAANILNELNFNDFKASILDDPISVLQQFPYIGPITVYHLAKNIGIHVAKPDRHLVRMAKAAGYSDVQLFCRTISKLSGDSIPVVDIVLWRFATIEKDYSIFQY
ncbi:MAG: hypothetical protein WBH08_11565 [Methanothrix sp.]|jgi:hypothetical protein|uniref:hypothetical protein n=1 Tax=Methanothrix sp. TaxID=90426 RepID=UPI003BB60AF9